MNETIEDVHRFWDALPLGVGCIVQEPASEEWIAEFDHGKRNYALAGILETFAPATLRGQHVLDVGCGPGFWARHLICMEVDYTGIDISARSVGLARRSLDMDGWRGSVLTANAEALPFEDNSFQGVVREGVIHHTPNTQACIDEIYRVLQPAGRAAVSTCGPQCSDLVRFSR